MSAYVLHGVILLEGHLNIDVNYLIVFSLTVLLNICNFFSKYNNIEVSVPSNIIESIVHMCARGVETSSYEGGCLVILRKNLMEDNSDSVLRDGPYYMHVTYLNWVTQISIQFKYQLNLKCKLFLCRFEVILSVN